MYFYKNLNTTDIITSRTDLVEIPGFELLTANTTDAAVEKHVPEVTQDGSRLLVKVGSVEHPMLDAHYIMFIALETCCGLQQKVLAPGEKPEAEFILAEGEKALAVYEFCNLHGLWKKEL